MYVLATGRCQEQSNRSSTAGPARNHPESRARRAHRWEVRASDPELPEGVRAGLATPAPELPEGVRAGLPARAPELPAGARAGLPTRASELPAGARAGLPTPASKLPAGARAEQEPSREGSSRPEHRREHRRGWKQRDAGRAQQGQWQ